jgi:hypothetical protein
MFKVFALILSAVASLNTCSKIKVKNCENAPVNKTFGMDVSGWDFYSEATREMQSPEQGRYEEQNGKLVFHGIDYRLGSRISTKEKYCIDNKVIYVKWKVGHSYGFSDYRCSFYYDKDGYGGDNTKRIDFNSCSISNTYNQSVLIQPGTWYYARISIDNSIATCTTSTGDYSNNNGQIIQTRTTTLPSAYGHLAIRQGDTFGGRESSITLAEYRISSK